ncbi:protein kinase [bacterium]|nr:protein kinase [bacterium]
MTADTSEMQVFLSALDIESPGERAAYLNEACKHQPELQDRVAALLRAHDRENLLLDRPPSVIESAWVGLQRAIQPAENSPGIENQILERPGTVIGPYRLMEQIGEGGFGLVFVAEQSEPLKRKVALKVIKPGMDTREVIARFEAERQALAMMDHPHIAQVLDAGATSSGRPYFVMELVRGIPINEFCDRAVLSIPDRLLLFITVCQAIQHAHQKGIIHRDIKPSNVLVTLHDGQPVAKVIDFGVAKAIGPTLTERTIYTRFAQLVGTPLYMSPEQAEMSGLDVDTRSDIYSLGVVLYELLTGTTPFDSKRLAAASYAELRQILCEEQPPTPSSKSSTLGANLATISQHRGLDGRQLTSQLQGDLDRIVMKALEKDRRHRYASAAEFAADLRRYLNEEPVEARAPSKAYRFWKFARRNKLMLTAGAMVLVSLIMGTTVSTILAIRAMEAREAVEQLQEEAVEFASRLKESNILIDRARGYIDDQQWSQAAAEYQRAGELQPEHALVWSGRGQLLARLGLWQEAAADYAHALDLGSTPNGPGWAGVPLLFYATGDTERYRQLTLKFCEQVGKSSDPFVAMTAIRSCLIAPESPYPLDALQLMLAEFEPPEPPDKGFGRGPMDGPPPFRKEKKPRPDDPDKSPRRERNFRIGFGMGGPGQGMDMGGPGGPGPMFDRALNVQLALRTGDSAAALEQVQRDYRDDFGPMSAGYQEWMRPTLAMAQYHQGQIEQARETLRLADEFRNQQIDQWLAQSLGQTPWPWPVWLEFLVWHREATLLITGQELPTDPRLQALEARARLQLHLTAPKREAVHSP